MTAWFRIHSGKRAATGEHHVLLASVVDLLIKKFDFNFLLA